MRGSSLGIIAALSVALCACSAIPASPKPKLGQTGPSAEEQERTINALRPPKRERPLIAALGDNAGTETTDFLVPFSVLTESNVADVIAVAPRSEPIQLMPALRVQPQQTTAAFDALYPKGADYVIVPAMHHTDTKAVLDWIRAQFAGGAIIVSVCSGAKVVAEAGLLEGRAGTTHWFDVDSLERDNPTLQRVNDRRYVVDRGVVTTTGVTASVPISLALVEAIAGRPAAQSLARRLGASEDWSARHTSSDFQLNWRIAGRAAINWLAFWNHERIGIQVEPGFDSVALAFSADAYSRTFKSKVETVARFAGPILSKRGLLLLPDSTEETAQVDRFISIGADILPAAALDIALKGIQTDYGDRVASFVALQLEYSRSKRR
ncbi:MAG: DJ-1/PfpI family protein [Myxococcota bacterium]